MFVVDSQVHVWAADSKERPWPKHRISKAQKPYPVTKELVVEGMDEAAVDRVVLVPPSWEGDRNDVALEAARAHPERFAVMGRLDIATPDPDRVARWQEEPGMLGVRLTLHDPRMKAWLSDGTADWFWRAAEEGGVPVMVFVPGAVPEIDAVAERHPGLKLVIDHLALGIGGDGDPFEGLDDVLRLARLSNVAVKASALPCYTSESYPFRGLHGHIRRVYDAFGPKRMFLGHRLDQVALRMA